MKHLILTILLLPTLAFSQDFSFNTLKFKGKKVRTGILKTDSKTVKAHIIYMQGLGDSMLNHKPLFDKLTRDGFNIIAFDYLGQGGSEGSMNSMTIDNIGKLMNKVWKFYVKDDSKKNILGWSTGGMAAYKYTYENPYDVETLALLAPGIVPGLVIGDKFKITEETLTSYDFEGVDNPHIDPIRPSTPLKVPVFVTSLFKNAFLAQFWKLNENIRSMALFGSQNDSYVNTNKSYDVISSNNSHFELHKYDDNVTLHALDNERPEVANDVHERLIRFFN